MIIRVHNRRTFKSTDEAGGRPTTIAFAGATQFTHEVQTTTSEDAFGVFVQADDDAAEKV